MTYIVEKDIFEFYFIGLVMHLHIYFQIAHIVENICSPVFWLFEPCWKLVEACVPDALEQFVNSGLPPREFCEFVYLCQP